MENVNNYSSLISEEQEPNAQAAVPKPFDPLPPPDPVNRNPIPPVIGPSSNSDSVPPIHHRVTPSGKEISNVTSPKNEIFAEKTSTTPNELHDWCSKQNLPWSMISLDEPASMVKIAKNTFVYTGNKKNELNMGATHHWLFLSGQHLFDSYGRAHTYKLPFKTRPLNTTPKRLQSWGSNVCGQYCCLLYKFIFKGQGNKVHHDTGSKFSYMYGYTRDKNKNDKITLMHFKKHS